MHARTDVDAYHEHPSGPFSLGPNRNAEAKAVADKIVPAIRPQQGRERCEFFADDEAGDYGYVLKRDGEIRAQMSVNRR